MQARALLYHKTNTTLAPSVIVTAQEMFCGAKYANHRHSSQSTSYIITTIANMGGKNH